MLNFLLLICGIAGLWLGSETLIKGAMSLADRYRLSDALFGMLVLAIGTDLPELFVAFDASFRSLAGEDLSLDALPCWALQRYRGEATPSSRRRASVQPGEVVNTSREIGPMPKRHGRLKVACLHAFPGRKRVARIWSHLPR